MINFSDIFRNFSEAADEQLEQMQIQDNVNIWKLVGMFREVVNDPRY